MSDKNPFQPEGIEAAATGASAEAATTAAAAAVEAATDASAQATGSAAAQALFDGTPPEGLPVDGVADMFSESNLDTVWTDLDGDVVDVEYWEAGDEGPFSIDDGGTYDDPFALPVVDDGGLVGEPIAVLIPWETDGAFIDPWALPTDGQDWTQFTPYDPMVTCSDWTVDGWCDASAYDTSYDYAPTFDTEWLSEPGSYYQDPGYYEAAGYWDTAGYYDSTQVSFDPTQAFVDPAQAAPFDAYVDPSAGYDAGFQSTTVYDPSAYTTSWDSSSATGWSTPDWTSGFDTSAGYPTSTYDPTAGYDSTSSYDPTSAYDGSDSGGFDIEAASTESQAWHEVYEYNSGLEWDYWNASVDASVAGDSMAAYELNQLSLEAGSYSDEAWNYSNQAWSDNTFDDGWYDAMSLDSSSSWSSTSTSSFTSGADAFDSGMSYYTDDQY